MTQDRPHSSPVVETRGLTKRYGSITAVDGLDLAVRRGEVYGFLGPNGAGKTTTLRMLLGLIKPTSGTAAVLDEEPGSPAGLLRTGALVESPGFYPYLSGRDNLRVVARYGGAARSRIGEILELVELSGRANDKYKKYSLGMKQRLGVAAALLKDPELLILDEPTNGLDPKGMANMRALIRRLGQGERTVLLSSHLLGEVEQVCDRAGVIHKGALVAEGTVDELRGGEGLLRACANRRVAYVSRTDEKAIHHFENCQVRKVASLLARPLIRAEPLEEAAEIASWLDGVEEVRKADGMLRLVTDPARAAEINAKLVSAGLRVSELRPVERSLEEVFLELTDGETV